MSTQYQCVALIKILRYLAPRQVDERSYAELQELVAILSDPFEKIRAGNSDLADIQQSIGLVRRALRNYMKTLSDVDPTVVTALLELVDAARRKDEAKANSMISFTFVKKPGSEGIKRSVRFVLYEAGGRKQLWVKNILADSDFADWIFDLNRDSGKPRIALLDNIHFYVGFRGELDGAESIGLISGGNFRAKRAVSSFEEALQPYDEFGGKIYALVDRSPQVHFLFLVDTQLLGVLSLAMLIGRQYRKKALVLKGK
ncbi:unnamed protein product [Rhizoctonia solani]|uniref:Uncharacterized protein n=1 Tax=Rhizoctonia solani TaxID=456999 RepID=A0A8H3DL66_9AGAM|nr:unnamed protein product [Rhizoctonia solani]